MSVKGEEKQKVFEYFTIRNTVDEYHTKITGIYISLEAAKKGLEARSDWWCANGTGEIWQEAFYQCSDGVLESHSELVYKVTQQDILAQQGGKY